MRVLLLIAAAGLLVAADVKDEKSQKELKKLAGTWTLESGEVDGKAVPDEHVRKNKITWTEEKVSLDSPHQSKEPIKARITRIDPTKSPPEMEFTRSTGPNANKAILAIYEFLGEDRYRVCFDPSGKDRPTEFKTRPGSGHILHVWKRVKE